MSAGKIKPWILAARPKTLGAAVAPVLVGSTLGWKLSGEFCVWLMLATLGSCICLQIATNFFNDAVDAMKGSDTEERLGPVRITASGMMSASAVMRAAVLFLLIASVMGAALIWQCGWPILAIGIPSLWFCYGYTGGPVPLAYRGLGELFVVLFFGLIAVTGSAFVQSGKWHVEALVAGLQIGCLSTVLIAINNLRDIEEDTKTGKKTLAVRFGKTFARVEITLLYLITLALCFYWQTPAVRWAPFAIAFLAAAGLATAIWKTEPSPRYNKFLAMAGASLLAFSFAFIAALIWG
ncbi:1,4-dihydroxy-2-naphthoate polyprenyltransferase [Verrucomicrobium sp. BvORR034]|uniref:1,4-dihydroxy-2-naphthoate polyprenyltransferase n=1 Tax=Verrucomicrobium sp. BvORR034 TaxID=1396418 RepID=UPI0006789136|nr:1,4-dihydroxy-2-naphthoate polyprenyltransferase [Verrucomicrobium sp. BvORR034]